jgi:hypothetical protein
MVFRLLVGTMDVATMSCMARPTRFEHFRYVGDKRTQVVYDLDDDSLDPAIVDALIESEAYTSFGPDTLAEARNRCYRLWRGQRSE